MPTVLVKNKAGADTYEAGVSALSVLAQYEMTGMVTGGRPGPAR